MKNYNIEIALIFTFLTLLSSCNDNLNSLNGTKWKSKDNTMEFIFDSDSTCSMVNRSPYDFPNNSTTGNYRYNYEHPNISLLTVLSSGFRNYDGSVSGKIMTLTDLAPIFPNSNSIILNKIK